MKKPEADYPPFLMPPNLQSIRNLIESLQTHRVNTLTELCRIERVAASCDSEDDARAFQEPMTAAWRYYVNSNQMLSELRGLTSSYPFCGDILTQARLLVDNDPDSNRSWNLAWLCLVKIRDEYVLSCLFSFSRVFLAHFYMYSLYVILLEFAIALAVRIMLLRSSWLLLSNSTKTYEQLLVVVQGSTIGLSLQHPSAYRVLDSFL